MDETSQGDLRLGNKHQIIDILVCCRHVQQNVTFGINLPMVVALQVQTNPFIIESKRVDNENVDTHVTKVLVACKSFPSPSFQLSVFVVVVVVAQ